MSEESVEGYDIRIGSDLSEDFHFVRSLNKNMQERRKYQTLPRGEKTNLCDALSLIVIVHPVEHAHYLRKNKSSTRFIDPVSQHRSSRLILLFYKFQKYYSNANLNSDIHFSRLVCCSLHSLRKRSAPK